MATSLCRLSLSKSTLCQLYRNSRNIMTTPAARAKNLLDSIKDNPYFEKYAKSITRLQETNPEDFIARIEAKQAKEKKKIEEAKKFKNDSAAKPQVSESMQKNQAKLADVMKIELLADKGKQDISDIWINYHKDKDCISGILEPHIFDELFEKGSKYPTFILPLPRDNGYEFILVQFAGTEIHMTPLLWYQTHKENAPECMTIVHYQELKESKGIILMRGQFDTKSISVQEAQCLANQLQLYYTTNNETRLKLLQTFNQRPDEFKHMDLVKQLENVELFTNNSDESVKKSIQNQ